MTNANRPVSSLTKREIIAKDLLAAILSNPVNNQDLVMGVNGGFIEREAAAREAISYTDELLRRLGEPK